MDGTLTGTKKKHQLRILQLLQLLQILQLLQTIYLKIMEDYILTFQLYNVTPCIKNIFCLTV